MFQEQFINRANQCIESIDIIESTKSIETLKSRISLLRDRFNEILPIYEEHSDLYASVLIETFQFHVKLWKKQIQPIHLFVLNEPSTTKLERFLSQRIYDTFERFYYSKKDEMNNLKTESAIKKRKEEIIKVGYDFKYLYKFLEIPDKNNYQDKIEEFRAQFYWKANN